ncbi:UbiA family prenyltransferase [Polaribacter sp.]|uniref:UbiA family prenyltransferase n=1 Tax=Polaribacter sp. TaxID=1920175 RepID=UPI003EFAA77D
MVLLTMILTKYALIDSIFFSDISFQNYYLIHTTYLGITLTHYQFIIFACSILCCVAVGYIVYAIYNVEATKINNPKKVIIGNSISKKKAWFYFYITSFLGLMLGISVSFSSANIEYSFIFLGLILLLFLYAKYLKKILIIGNLLHSIFLSLVLCITVLFNEPHVQNSNLLEVISNIGTGIYLLIIVLTYITFIVLTSFIKVNIKNIININGDIKIKAKTMAILLGRKRASKVAFFFSCILFIFLLIVLQFSKNEPLFLLFEIVFILFPLIYFMFQLYVAQRKKEFIKLHNQITVIMLFGILSMILFKFT